MDFNSEYDCTKSMFRPEISLQWDGIDIKRQKSKMSFVSHWHDAIEILLGISGVVAVGVGGKFHELHPDEVIIVGSRTSHCVSDITLQSERISLIFEPALVFSSKLLTPYRDIFSRVEPHSFAWPEAVRREMKDLLLNLCRDYNAKENGWEAATVAGLMEIADVAIRKIPKCEESRTSQGDSVTLQMVEYLSQNYLEDISLESCAQALGFNISYLSSKFKSQVGVTFHQYLVNLRLNHAEWLLRDDDTPVELVAEKSGFSSSKTFYRVFRDKNGISPKQYRFQWKNRN